MSFIKSSIFYEYLYSPKSWLHKQNNKFKIYACFIQLFFLPYSSFFYLNLVFFILLLLYNSINVPKSVKKYLKKMMIFFICFLLVNIEQKNINDYNLISTRKIFKVFPINNITLSYFNKEISLKKVSSSYFYLPVSIIRLLTINIVYLFVIKLLLLTTHHNNIIKCILVKIKKFIKSPEIILNLEIMISSQFLNIICYQIEVLKIAYITRNIKLTKKNNIKENIAIYIFFIKQLLLNISQNIYSISHALYSREVKFQSLNFYH